MRATVYNRATLVGRGTPCREGTAGREMFLIGRVLLVGIPHVSPSRQESPSRLITLQNEVL